jgi:hypothetical protein
MCDQLNGGYQKSMILRLFKSVFLGLKKVIQKEFETKNRCKNGKTVSSKKVFLAYLLKIL